jgi:N-acetylglutamate synthase-like GNAT family acetyltransferase
MEIRRAKPDEARTLTEIAHAAKRYWGYPESWIEHWKTDLTITPNLVANNEVFVAVIDDEIVGCCALALSDSLAELEHMWINPRHMGKGVGCALFEFAKARTEHLHLSALELSADPNAEGFYERMGAVRIGEVQATIDGQPRILPRMKIEL